MEEHSGLESAWPPSTSKGNAASAASTISTGVGSVLRLLDGVVQRTATTTGLSKLPPKRSPPSVQRQFNRIVALAIALFIFFFVQAYKWSEWVDKVEVPILGRATSDLNLLYPPIGTGFHPQVPEYNVYSKYRPRTPLFIPFTRNNTMLQQALLSYISAGWPRSDIIILDNSGTMDANQLGQLSEKNPFFLDYDLYRRRYGVSILQTPTLLNFAQMQNYMLRVAITRDWPYYFWSHMDVVVLSAEDITPYKSFYHRVIDILDASDLPQYKIQPVLDSPRESQSRSGLPSHDNKGVFTGHFDRKASADPEFQARRKRSLEKRRTKWAVKFFDFDNLALINVAAWRKIGQWDVFIPYYNTDCDAYSRLTMAGYHREDVQAGYMYDVASAVANPEERFFPGSTAASREKWGTGPEGTEPPGGKLKSWRFKWLKSELEEMMSAKNTNALGRNTWQGGGLDGVRKRPTREEWSYDFKGFQSAWWATADYGRSLYVRKWGTLECDLVGENKTIEDAWLADYLDADSEAAEERKFAEDYWNSVLAEGPIR